MTEREEIARIIAAQMAQGEELWEHFVHIADLILAALDVAE